MRSYRAFHHKGAAYRIASSRPALITGRIVSLREKIEAYIESHPGFAEALTPIPDTPDAPPIVSDMIRGASAAGVGPMAAVAGAIAQHSAGAAAAAGAEEAIVENGGDIYLISSTEAVVSLFAGPSPLAHRLALRVAPGEMPLAVCSSSAVMGHSMSFGGADLVTVTAKNAALADAAATALCNQVKTEADIEPALEKGNSIAEVSGILVVLGDKIGLAGDLPEIVRQADIGADGKVSGNFQEELWRL